MNNIILYHANCLDGFGAAYAAWKYFGEDAKYIPVEYGKEFPKEAIENPKETNVFILDFSYDRETLEYWKRNLKGLVVLDHHKTAQEALEGFPNAIFDMNKSGCRIAWEYFQNDEAIPYLLEIIEDRDLWKWEYKTTRDVTKALYSVVDRDFIDWDHIIESYNYLFLYEIGHTLNKEFDKNLEKLQKHKHNVFLASQTTNIPGLAVNASAEYASELGHILAKESGTFGAVYYFDGERNKWNISLRSNGEFDVSTIAKYYSGGGHKNAAGCSVSTEVFNLFFMGNH